MLLELSREAEAIVQKKSEIFNISPSEVLDSMVLEFSPSTGDEIRKISIRRIKARIKDIGENPELAIEAAWERGYYTGWKEFQVRKSTSMYEKYKEGA